jgi:uncharacterized protein (TIRG00374 family)
VNTNHKSVRRLLGIVCQALLIIFILGFLFWQAAGNPEFYKMLGRDKRWGFLFLAVVCNLSSVMITFLRWRWLVRVLDIPFSYREMLRISSIGYLFNLAPAGIVSGDLIKIFLLARRYQGVNERITASVLIDRVIGLYVMFLVSCTAIFVTGFYNRPETIARVSTQIVLTLTIIASVCILLAMLPGVSGSTIRNSLKRIPYCGHFLAKMLEAFNVYRSHLLTLLVSMIVTFPVHILQSWCIWSVARGFFDNVTAAGAIDHIVMHTIANLTSMIPLAVGPYEAVLNNLYPLYLGDAAIGIGLVTALGYRLCCIVVAGIGIGFYLTNRREVAAVRDDLEKPDVE